MPLPVKPDLWNHFGPLFAPNLLAHFLTLLRKYTKRRITLRMDAFKLAIMSNLSLCCFHQTEYAQSAFYACKAMDHDPGSVKLLLRRARALSMKVGGGATAVGIKCCSAKRLRL